MNYELNRTELKKYNVLYLLFFLPPVLALFMYLAGGEKASNMTFMVSNVVGSVLLLKLTKKASNKLLMSFILLYFVSHLFIYNEIDGSKAYLSSTLYTNFVLIFFSEFNYVIHNQKQIVNLDKMIVYFTIILVIGQIMTIDHPFQFVRTDYNSLEEDALEKKGFLISHSFGYYMSALVMYYAFKRKIFYMAILTIICFWFSRRTVVILVLIGWAFYLKEKYGNKVCIIVVSFLIAFVVLYMGATVYWGNFAFSLDPNDTDAAIFTNGRSRFWGSFIYYKLLSGKMTLIQYLFGFGPASSRDFNLLYCNIKVWMHNDFFDLLYCLGCVGLSLYVYTIYKASRKIGLFFLTFLLLSANINGFMLYQTYPIVYLFVVINALKYKKCDDKNFLKKVNTYYTKKEIATM